MNGTLKVTEERELALVQRQVVKMDEETAAAEAERAKKAAEAAAWQPEGLVEWVLKVEELDESGLGMRIGVVHTSVVAGTDWNDYSGSNNRTWWWNNYSGQLFVGDMVVPESGNILSMEILSQWAPGRTQPEMGMPWGKGDVLTINLDLESCELRFFRNGIMVPIVIQNVYGEVTLAVQLMSKRDSVVLLEPLQQKLERIERVKQEERERLEQERLIRDAKRKAALASLGLV
mmetsp:Transcript_42244/g.99604  ORF Transcript_42244/g.99604 Transcript_42244/m.99604 type:complete len:232 (-) Transcript_42244:90-785(-)